MANRVKAFFDEVTAELKKVTWPSRDELYGSTIVVLLMTSCIAIFIGVVDFFVSKLITFLIR